MIAPRRWAGVALAAVGLLLVMWSATVRARVEQFRQEAAVALTTAPPLYERPAPGATIGVLEIPRLGVCTPIIEGDDAAALAKGAGHLADTAPPGAAGNAALAGHRDTVFRPLARVRQGDRVLVTTARGRFEYAIRDTQVVAPTDLSVLRDEARPVLTLITCYPFRLIGRAPKRFVVHADFVSGSAPADGPASGPPSCGQPRSL